MSPVLPMPRGLGLLTHQLLLQFLFLWIISFTVTITARKGDIKSQAGPPAQEQGDSEWGQLCPQHSR
jgi:hypothetical protein